MVMPIKITSMEDVEYINNYAAKFAFPTWVHSRSQMADAKSLLGLVAMINQPDLVYVVPDDVDPKSSFKGLKKLAA